MVIQNYTENGCAVIDFSSLILIGHQMVAIIQKFPWCAVDSIAHLFSYLLFFLSVSDTLFDVSVKTYVEDII